MISKAMLAEIKVPPITIDPTVNISFLLIVVAAVFPLFLKRMIRPSSLQNHCRAKNFFHSQKEILEAEMEGLAKALEHDIMTNISLASDQEAYSMRRESLESQWLKKKEEIGRLDDLISDKILRAGRIDAFIEEMQNLNAIKEFSPQAWGVMVERVTVKRDGEIDFSFIDGSRVRV